MATKTRTHGSLPGNTSVTFDSMIKRFGVVTVMNASIYDAVAIQPTDTISNILDTISRAQALCTLDTLKIANVTVEGPDKTVTGGQYSNPLIKFGKSARLEMQDALGNADAIAHLGGGILEGNEGLTAELALHVGENFVGPKTIVGESFFIDQKTGAQVPVKIIFYQFLPDSLFNLSQDAEGDATVFDMNGDLLATTITVKDAAGADQKVGLFYSIVDATETGQAAA